MAHGGTGPRVARKIRDDLTEAQARLADLGEEAAALPHEAAQEALRLARATSRQLERVERRLEGSYRQHPRFWMGAVVMGAALAALAWSRKR